MHSIWAIILSWWRLTQALAWSLRRLWKLAICAWVGGHLQRFWIMLLFTLCQVAHYISLPVVIVWHFACNDSFKAFHSFFFPLSNLLDPWSAFQNEFLSVSNVLSTNFIEVWLMIPNTFSFSYNKRMYYIDIDNYSIYLNWYVLSLNNILITFRAGSESSEVATFPVDVERFDRVHFADCSWNAWHTDATK